MFSYLQLLAQVTPSTDSGIAQAAVSAAGVAPFSPWLVICLCALGAVGLGLLLPAHRPTTFRRLGGAVLALAGLMFSLLLLRQVEHLRITGEVGAYFWAFATIAIVSSVRVITHPKPVYSALYFVLTVFASAGLFVLLQAEFMAAALVLIYAGAVLVTYVFVIMLAAESSGGTGSEAVVGDADKVSRDPFLAGAIGFALLGVILMVVFDGLPARPTVVAADHPGMAFRNSPEVQGDTQELGKYLYQQQLVPVQLAMLVLTLAMTGAVLISRRKIVAPLKPKRVTSEPVNSLATPTDDDPHSIPVYGTDDPKAKQFPQT